MYGFIKQNTAGVDKCGVVFPLPEYNGEGITAYTASARAKGAPVLITFAYTSGQQATAATPSTTTYGILAFAYEAIAAGQIGRFVLSGINVPVLVDDTLALSAGDSLEVINAGVAAIDQGGTGHTVITVHAVIEEAVTAAENGGSPLLKKCTIPPNFPYKTIAGS